MSRKLEFLDERLLRKLENHQSGESQMQDFALRQALVCGTDDDTTTIVYQVVLREKYEKNCPMSRELEFLGKILGK